MRSEENGTSAVRTKTGVKRIHRQPALACGDDEGAFGRISLHRPPPVALQQYRVAGAIGDGERADQLRAQRAIDCTAVLALHLAFRRVARARQSHTAARRDDCTNRHLVLGQCSGLVGGDDVRRAECFDRREMPYDGIPLCHALHAKREDGSHHRRQALRHRRDRERDAQN